MNFYPYLEKSYHASKSILLFLIANAGLIIASLSFLIGWQLWYNSFFIVLHETLQETAISGDVATKLITQAYGIGKSLLIVLPIILIAWRISIPYTYAQLNLLEKARAWWHILIFDIIKVMIIALLITIAHTAWAYSWWLAGITSICLVIITFSFTRFFETIYFSSPHQHRFSHILKSWVAHLSNISFLHLLDFCMTLFGFCLLGIFMASFTYLPFWLGTAISIILITIWGKILLIGKGLWSYAAYALLNDNVNS